MNAFLNADRPLRVLVVDDCSDNRESLALLLRLWGNDVHTAADGLSALRECEEFRPEVMLLDIGLPRMSGWEVAARLRERDCRPALLIAVTGFTGPLERAQSRNAGFDFHLSKPTEPWELRRLLEAAVANSGSAD